jgi:hypothetical protein
LHGSLHAHGRLHGLAAGILPHRRAATVENQSEQQHEGRDQRKDQGQWDWKNGAATTAAELGDPVNEAPSYYWCVYDSEGLVFGARSARWHLRRQPVLEALEPDKLQYQSKLGNTFGVSNEARGRAGRKSSIRVKAKSKVGNFVAPTECR